MKSKKNVQKQKPKAKKAKAKAKEEVTNAMLAQRLNDAIGRNWFKPYGQD